MKTMLEAEKLTVRRDGRSIADEVSVGAQEGEVLALLGCNGAGKSTVLKCLSGEWTPDAGRVRMDGRELGSFSKIELARRRAVVPQSSSLAFPFLVREVVEQGRAPFAGPRRKSGPHEHEIVEAALDAVEMVAFADRDYLTLSGGERQRVHLARALAQIWGWEGTFEGKLLLLDEPTAALDLRHQHQILKVVRDFSRRGGSAIVVLHDLNLCSEFADRCLLLCEGRTYASGSADVVLAPDLLSEAYGIPIEAREWDGAVRFFPRPPEEEGVAGFFGAGALGVVGRE